jgi:DNA invertase Pin-like site-specific DNA recombinase
MDAFMNLRRNRKIEREKKRQNQHAHRAEAKRDGRKAKRWMRHRLANDAAGGSFRKAFLAASTHLRLNP